MPHRLSAEMLEVQTRLVSFCSDTTIVTDSQQGTAVAPLPPRHAPREVENSHLIAVRLLLLHGGDQLLRLLVHDLDCSDGLTVVAG